MVLKPDSMVSLFTSFNSLLTSIIIRVINPSYKTINIYYKKYIIKGLIYYLIIFKIPFKVIAT